MTAAEAERALERDWLFQAMGEPLLHRTALELEWARHLAGRLTAQHAGLDLSSELRALDACAQKLTSLDGSDARTAALPASDTIPHWIWYPEGDATQNAPAAARFFRRRFELPRGIGSATLRVAADDACEVFLNGTRVASHDTWQRAAVLPVGPLLHAGENVLAVR
ncbi:MAG: hypothetical protein FJ272_22290, partial [Planctomycetes bacterium]|nr:hypothetical protein [Planctomycetota bacterium]